MHPWVNYDQILQKCFIGRLVVSDTSLTVDDFMGKSPASSKTMSLQSPTKQSSLKLMSKQSSSAKDLRVNQLEQSQEMTNFSGNSTKYDPKNIPSSNVDSSRMGQLTSDVPKGVFEDLVAPVQVLPRFDWIQKLETISVIFYTKAFSNPMVEIYPPEGDRAVTISLTYDDIVYQVSIKFMYYILKCFADTKKKRYDQLTFFYIILYLKIVFFYLDATMYVLTTFCFKGY